jgi:cation diffusion facilitator family transporter
VIMIVASVVNFALGHWLVRRGRRIKSLILVADGRHVVADGWTSTGVFVGVALLYLTGWQWLDSAVAALVGLNILWTGYSLVHQAVMGLMDRADPEMLTRIVAALREARQPGWMDLHQLRAWQAGEATYVDFHLVVPEHWTVSQLHDTHVDCREALRRVLGNSTEIIIHFDPGLRDPLAIEESRPWTVASAVRVPAAGELGSETVSTETIEPVSA